MRLVSNGPGEPCHGGGSRAPAPERFIAELSRHSLDSLVANASGRAATLIADGYPVPVLLPGARDTTAICSMSAYYFGAAADEMAVAPSRFVRSLARPARLLARLPLDPVVLLGSYLTGTSPRTDFSRIDVAAMTGVVAEAFPDRPICVSALVEAWDADAMAAFVSAGYRLVPKRPVWTFDPATSKWRSSRDIRRDRALIRNQGPCIRLDPATLSEADFARMAELQKLCLGTHPSRFHPDYLPTFFRLCVRHGPFRLSGSRDGAGDIDRFLLLGVGDGGLSSGLWGYDPTGPDAYVMYRMTIAEALETSIQLGIPVNFGYGGDNHKKHRRARQTMEHFAVFTDHLPRRRRLLWRGATASISAAAARIVPRMGKPAGPASAPSATVVSLSPNDIA